MHCPSCQSERLVMSERQGIEIDCCPKCGGVWLDRGELDKIIERSAEERISASPSSPSPAAPAPPVRQRGPASPPVPPRDMHDSDYGKYRYKRRKHWLAELFD